MQETPLRHAPATARNREAILTELQRILPPSARLLLEIASGTGEHAAFMTPQLPTNLRWQPSDADQENLAQIDGHARASHCDRILGAIVLDVTEAVWPIARADAVLCCNMIHIAPFAAAEGLFAGASRILGITTPLVLYGPFRRHRAHTAPSNESFDASLKSRNPSWGVRCLDSEIVPLAERTGFALAEVVAMPANNLTVVFRRS